MTFNCITKLISSRFWYRNSVESNFLLVLLTSTPLRLNGGNSRWPITFVYKTNSKRPRFSVILFLFRHFLSNYKWRYLSAFSQIPLTELPQVTFSYTLTSVAVPQKLFNRGFIRISRSYLLFWYSPCIYLFLIICKVVIKYFIIKE